MRFLWMKVHNGTVLRLLGVWLHLQAAVGHEVVFVQSLCDVVAKVGNSVDYSGLFRRSRVILLNKVVLQRDEVQRVVADAVIVNL